MSILGELTPADDYFDAAQGLYWYAADYHEGQSSELYSILSAQLGYKPAMGEGAPEVDSAAEWVYDALVAGEVSPSDVLAFVNAGYDATSDSV